MKRFVGKMIAELKASGPFDGVYLCVHGAMAVRGVARPEAELARRVREVVGPKAFIAATFDLHGNEDEEFLKHADMAFAVKYFPHYDGYLQGERAARTLVRAIRGDYKPAHVDDQGSDHLADGAAMDRRVAMDGSGAARADLGSARAGRYVNVFFGFPFADVPDVGMTIQVLTNGNPELAQRIAATWRSRPGVSARRC